MFLQTFYKLKYIHCELSALNQTSTQSPQISYALTNERQIHHQQFNKPAGPVRTRPLTNIAVNFATIVQPLPATQVPT